MSTAWFSIVTRLGLLLWLATDHFILLVLAALIGLAAALAVGTTGTVPGRTPQSG